MSKQSYQQQLKTLSSFLPSPSCLIIWFLFVLPTTITVDIMNLCAFSRQGAIVKNHMTATGSQQQQQQQLSHRNRLEEILCSFYLSQAKLDFDSQEGRSSWLSVGSTSAQGWRVHQEDAHLADLHFADSDQLALFAVFDGHSGAEVAHYAARKLPEVLQSNGHFARQQYGEC